MRNVTPRCGCPIPIGRLGENEATQVIFNIADFLEFGDGTFSLLHQRAGDPAPYPCAIERHDNTVTWEISSGDCSAQGYGRCELIYTVGSVIVKSEIWTTFTGTALTGAADPPEPWESWVEQVLAAGAAAQESAGDAAESAAEAANYAEVAAAEAQDAETSAENAQGSAEAAAESAASIIVALNAYRTSEEQDVIDLALSADIEDVELDVAAINAKIPTQATAQNQLADKNFVNSSIGTNTANYISNSGQPFTSVAQLEAYSGTVTNNDYAFVTGTDTAGNTYFDRYKATVSGSTVTWAKEYRLNNSSFTAEQWAAISSGITSGDVALIYTALQPSALNAYRTAAAQDIIDAGKQDKLPTTVKDRYLHTNASTGSLEWTAVQTAGKAYVASATAPSDHDKLWVDTTESGGGGGGVNYTTAPQDTGLKWVDGRTVYQVTINDVIEANSGQAYFTCGGGIGGNGAPTIVGVDGAYRLYSNDYWKQFNGLFFNQSMGIPEWCHVMVEGGFEMAIPMIFIDIRDSLYGSMMIHPEISLLLTIRYVEN